VSCFVVLSCCLVLLGVLVSWLVLPFLPSCLSFIAVKNNMEADFGCEGFFDNSGADGISEESATTSWVDVWSSKQKRSNETDTDDMQWSEDGEQGLSSENVTNEKKTMSGRCIHLEYETSSSTGHTDPSKESSRSETTGRQTEGNWAWGTGKIDIGRKKEKKVKKSKGKRKGQSTVEERAELFLQALVKQGGAHFLDANGETAKKLRREPDEVRVPVGALKRLKKSIPRHIHSSTPVFMRLLLSLPVDLVERSSTSAAARRELRAKFISPSCGELPADGDLSQKGRRDLDFFFDSQAALLMEETRARLAASLEVLAKSKGAIFAPCIRCFFRCFLLTL
jgi:hypothetical protein